MTENKFEHLKAGLRQFDTLLVAFSGGLDSGFLLWTAISVLGPDKVLAVIGDSPSYATGEKEQALAFATAIGLSPDHVRVIQTDEMDIAGYRENSTQRCYHCKTELYGKLAEIARDTGFSPIADGFNHSDKGDFRPGHKAAAEIGVISPLADAGLEKHEIIALARRNNLALADKPASACLSSRIPFGTPITPDMLKQVDNAECGLKKLGLKGFRVRHHGTVARLELAPEDIAMVTGGEMREKIIAIVKAAGFAYVTLDLEGYRQGSFNPEHGKTWKV